MIDLSGSGALTGSTFNPSAAATGKYNFAYIVTTSGSCVSTDSAIISIQVSSAPSKTLTVSDAKSCEGSPVRVTITAAENGITYQLKDSVTFANGSQPVIMNKTGDTVLIPTTVTPGSYVYKVYASVGSCETA